jgi:hypothetical protein
VRAHLELAGVVGDDHRPGQQAMVDDRPPERALQRSARFERDGQPVGAERGEVHRPGQRVGERLGRVRHQQIDHRPDKLHPRIYSSAAALCKSAVGLNADQRRNTPDFHISPGSVICAD